MKILLFGGNGQLGKCITDSFENKFDIKVYTNKQTDQNYCDFKDEKSIISAIDNYKPNIILNAAAYTDVDRSEIFREKANQINNISVKAISLAAKKINATLIHFSTDYVYKGRSEGFNFEDDNLNPLNYYGLTKLMGERMILNSGCKYIILRLSWVYSFHKKNNFIMKIIEKVKKNQKINIFNNEIGSITSVNFITENIEKVIFYFEKENKDIKEIFNLCTSNPSRRIEIVNKIIDKVETNKIKSKEIKKNVNLVSSNKNNYLALRPNNSSMSTTKFSNFFNLKLISWEEDLENFIKKYEKTR